MDSYDQFNLTGQPPSSFEYDNMNNSFDFANSFDRQQQHQQSMINMMHTESITTAVTGNNNNNSGGGSSSSTTNNNTTPTSSNTTMRTPSPSSSTPSSPTDEQQQQQPIEIKKEKKHKDKDMEDKLEKQKTRRNNQNVASRNYRQRKKTYIKEMEDKINQLTLENDSLKRDLGKIGANPTELMRIPQEMVYLMTNIRRIVIQLDQALRTNQCEATLKSILNTWHLSMDQASALNEKEIERFVHPYTQIKLTMMGYKPLGNPWSDFVMFSSHVEWWAKYSERAELTQEQGDQISALWQKFSEDEATLKREMSELDEKIKKFYMSKVIILPTSDKLNTLAQSNIPVDDSFEPNDTEMTDILEFTYNLERLKQKFIKMGRLMWDTSKQMAKFLSPRQESILLVLVHSNTKYIHSNMEMANNLWNQLNHASYNKLSTHIQQTYQQHQLDTLLNEQQRKPQQQTPISSPTCVVPTSPNSIPTTSTITTIPGLVKNNSLPSHIPNLPSPPPPQLPSPTTPQQIQQQIQQLQQQMNAPLISSYHNNSNLSVYSQHSSYRVPPTSNLTFNSPPIISTNPTNSTNNNTTTSTTSTNGSYLNQTSNTSNNSNSNNTTTNSSNTHHANSHFSTIDLLNFPMTPNNNNNTTTNTTNNNINNNSGNSSNKMNGHTDMNQYQFHFYQPM